MQSPQLSLNKTPSDQDGVETRLVESLCAELESAEGTPVPLQDLARIAELSPWSTHRLFKRVTGVTPRDYAQALREGRLRSELRRTGNVTRALYEAGYGSSSRLYESADNALGMTPATYARGGRGARIVYGLAPSDLGQLLLAATEHGLCFIALGADSQSLEQELRAEFHGADELRRDQAAVEEPLAEVLAYLEGQMPHFELPLDIRATAFQRRVWNELVAIPYGETRSYAEIAERLGLPKAQRAVGRACGSNPVSLVIPCHRVLRSDGGLGGYRWGVARKRRLLRQEAGAD
ncbi:methylated-DNA--[protein]-cysteine S-methyltransferase [Fodinicurvata fenggangensis]|uniref:methylated-DNA--[protein]-cysteine S-methyltransferase n=1 Tax=Fodinicurvata fenggangensis TaxID=1121830 RepID=UPI000690D1FE|nr:methylated-DNA--[protein]-cysteine S-methyltransferase [Fodinicurvata fenggangensis]